MTFPGHESDVNWVEWISDSGTFVSGSEDSVVRVFDVRANAQLTALSDDKVPL
jgi:WD40 repeat protein